MAKLVTEMTKKWVTHPLEWTFIVVASDHLREITIKTKKLRKPTTQPYLTIGKLSTSTVNLLVFLIASFFSDILCIFLTFRIILCSDR